VTTFIHADEDSVGLGRCDDPDSQVQTIESLTNVANEHIDEIVEKYPPLRRVQRYAALSAFLKWAIRERENGRLGAIDLSGLATYPAHDAGETPTADAILK
jgi:hypothetical protein